MVEALLADRFGGRVTLGAGEDLGGTARSAVFRFAVSDGPAGVPESVVVKRVNRDKGLSEKDRRFPPEWFVLNDWAGLEFVGRMFEGEPVAPRLHAGDHEACLFVSEDLGRLERLDDYLMGNDPDAAERALVGYSKVMGRLHARSHGLQHSRELIRLRSPE